MFCKYAHSFNHLASQTRWSKESPENAGDAQERKCYSHTQHLKLAQAGLRPCPGRCSDEERFVSLRRTGETVGGERPRRGSASGPMLRPLWAQGEQMNGRLLYERRWFAALDELEQHRLELSEDACPLCRGEPERKILLG